MLNIARLNLTARPTAVRVNRQTADALIGRQCDSIMRELSSTRVEVSR